MITRTVEGNCGEGTVVLQVNAASKHCLISTFDDLLTKRNTTIPVTGRGVL
jgi:hypothetical protein